MITWKNYEEFMVMHADGELTPAQEQELMSFLYEHPELQGELTAFTMTKIMPDTEETYTRKASLLKPIPAEKPKVIALPMWRRYAVAAGIAGLLFASAYSIFTSDNNNNTSPIASNNSQPVKTAPVNPAPAATLNLDMTQNTTGSMVKPFIQHSIAVAARQNTVTHKTNYNTHKPATAPTPVEYAYAPTTIERIPTPEAKELNAEQKNIAPVVTNVPALAIQYREDDTENETGNSFIDRLPVSDTKKAGMKSLASDAADQYGMVNSIRKEIANANVSVTLKNKKLTFSF